jgi:hypothetical protein
MVLCERSGRWAASLRRHGLVARLRLEETRSVVELDERAREFCGALIGLELTSATLPGVLDWLVRRPVAFVAKGPIVFAERGLRTYELVCREAGAIHFIDSELELFAFGAVVDRYLSDPAFAKLDEDELPLAERFRASLPW